MTYQPPATGLPDPMVLTCVSDDLVAIDLYVGQAASSQVYPAANTAYFMPVRLSQPRTYTKAWWINGATLGGTVDVGIYTLSGTTLTRVVASTAEAQSGASVLQVASTFTTTTIGPGLYYLAVSCNSGTATFWRASGGTTSMNRMAGIFQTATAHPLPTSATAASIGSATFPWFGFSENAAI